MKLVDIWKSKGRPTLSFELLPPKTPKSAENLEQLIAELPGLKPDFVSVTFGAGGSTRKGSSELVTRLKKDAGLEVLPYFAGFGLGQDDIIAVMESHKALGIESVLLVRGDEPKGQEDFKPHPDSFAHATDLIEFVRPKYDFCIGAAGYPEGHVECESKEKDLEFLKLKQDKGAQFIICTYFYNNLFFLDFVDRCRSAGITVPILPGVMPIYSVKMMNILASICGATITDEVKKGLDAVPEGDTAALCKFGIEFALNQCRGLLKKGVPGLHFYTMNRSASVKEIVKTLREESLI